MSSATTHSSFGAILMEAVAREDSMPAELSFTAGAPIFRELDPGDGMYVVLEGKIVISARVSSSNDRSLIELGEGEFFGEMAIIDDAPRSASASALTEARLLFISREQALSLMERSPELVLALLRAMSHRMREFNRHYVHDLLAAERLSAVGVFARSMVHDLKNQLGVIMLASELAASATVPAEVRLAAKERILLQVERLSDMLTEVLRVSGGSSPHEPEEVSLPAYIAGMFSRLREEFACKRVELVMPGPPPDVVLALCPKRLDHVFLNLFNNASDFMPGGGRVITRFEEGEHEIVIEVEDSGPGLNPETASRLFTPFFTEGKAHGTGLGLSICRSVVEDHGGEIRARAEPGRGAIFRFTLPRQARGS